MYKLLPVEEMEKVVQEYRRRRLSVMLMLLCFALAIAVFAVAPSLIQAQYKESSAKALLNSAEKLSRPSDRVELQSWADEIRGVLAVMAIPATGKPYNEFKLVIEEKIPGVKITSLSWLDDSKGKLLEVRGVATDRQTLIGFQNALKNSGAWRSAEFPVGALAKDADIDFSLTLIPR